MRSKTATRDHEMSWLLFEAADTKMFLVRKTSKKRKAPRSPSAGTPQSPPVPSPPVPSPPLPCAGPLSTASNGEQVSSPSPQPALALPAYEPPPPPYSHPPVPPKDDYKKQSTTSMRPPTPPPRPPKVPLPPPRPSKSPWSLKRSRIAASCNDISKLVAPPGQAGSQVAKPWDDGQLAPVSPENGLEGLISSKLDAVLTSIDGESFSGNEKELGIVLLIPCTERSATDLHQISTNHLSLDFAVDGALQAGRSHTVRTEPSLRRLSVPITLRKCRCMPIRACRPTFLN